MADYGCQTHLGYLRWPIMADEVVGIADHVSVAVKTRTVHPATPDLPRLGPHHLQ